jgi:uncharacterized protein (UPF0332 family)
MKTSFDTEFVMKGIFTKELSRDLHKAFELRQVLDYRTFEGISGDKAGEMLDKAIQFVAAVKKYFEDSAK